TVVRLLETTFIRVGNEEYARTNKSFGLTTLKDRHVDFAHGEVRFHFRGKSGVAHQVAVHDPRVARIVRRCRDLPGQDLFQYLSEDGKVHAIGSADVNEYIREIAGRDFTAKDFRTWAGTVLAARAFQEIAAAAKPSGAVRTKRPPRARSSASAARLVRAGAVGQAARNSMRAPRSRRSEKDAARTQKDVVRAISQVAERLGNTPAVCRKCYVHPGVITSFLDGKLVEALTTPAPRAVDGDGLRSEEAAVLALLIRTESPATTRRRAP
ncbi:MAG: hypothetical protein ABIS92_09810, partial [Polyangia bacterium]